MMTSLIHTARLSARQKADVQNLVSSCKAKEPLCLGAPVEDEDLGYEMFLLYEECRPGSNYPYPDILAAMSFLFFPQETLCECCVFVAPEKRRRGHFTRLLQESLDFLEPYEKRLGVCVDFCFLADERTPSAMAALEEIGAEYWYSEYKMERQLTPADKAAAPASLSIQDAGNHLYCAVFKGQVIGTCAILPSREDIYLYAFQIHEAFQGQGYGKEFLLGVLAILADMGSRVSIQVSGQNYIARHLYEKTGFQTTESLSYYLY